MGRIFFLILGSWFIFSGVKTQESLPEKDINPAYSSYLKGLLSDRWGDYQEALKEYIKAEKFDKGSTSLKLKIAVQHIKLNNIDKALEILEDLKGQKPLNSDAYLLLILIYSSRGEEAKANQTYEEMLSKLYEEKPNNLKIAESLAQFKFQKEDYSGALKIYENILKVKPDYSDAYFWIGYIYEEKGDRKEAIRVWKEGLKVEPQHPDILNSLGYIYAEEGINLDEAEILIKKALEIKPDSPAYLDSLGWVYFKKKNYLKAKEYLERASKVFQDPVILEHLGDTYYCLGEKEKAKEIWGQVLKFQPEKESVKEKLEGKGVFCQN